jgi:hypothetical protein
MRWTLCFLLLFAIVGSSVAVHAIERSPLPALPLTGIEGGVVTTSQMAMRGAWLIVYVQPDCRPCESILTVATHERHPGLPDRLAIVVAGVTARELQALAARFPNLPRNAWYADTNRTMFTRLRLTGVPVVLGLRDQMIEWGLSGVLPDASAVESVLASWVAR